MEINDGLICVRTDSDILSTTAALQGMPPGYKVLNIFVDHTDFVSDLRSDKIIPQDAVVTARIDAGIDALMNRAGVVAVQAVAEQEGQEGEEEEHGEEGQEAEEGEHVEEGEEHGEEGQEAEEGEHGDDTDSEFYDSDYDAEDGDDDIFEANVDKDVEDNTEKLEIVEQEDDAGLENEDIQLSREQQLELKYKFKTFNAEVDSENPQFKLGMVFSSIQEFRNALTVYNIRNRVKVRKIRNEAKRCHAVCQEDCTWFINASEDSRKGAIVVKKYEAKHTCEAVWELKALTSPFLTKYSLRFKI
jgi:hypothetical protein